MKKADLLDQLKIRDIQLPEDVKLTNKELEFMLGKHYYDAHPEVQTWGMTRRLFDFQTPQLCFSSKELKPSEQEEILKSEDWMADVKIDGARCLVFFHPDYGFEFYSRDISELTFLPNSYTDKILIVKDGVVRTPSSFKGYIKQPFVLDGEVVVSNSRLDTTRHGGGFSITELNSTISILGSAPERAREIQMDGNYLKFYMFDCLRVGDKDLTELPLRTRRKYLEHIMGIIKEVVPFEIPESTIENKQEFFNRITEASGEGIVIKNLNEKYYATPSRKRHVQVKMKRTISDAMHEDLDVFISGSFLPKRGSALDVQSLIGGIKVSVMLQEDDGTEVEHWVGSISGITDSLRRKMTVLDEDGKPTINPEYLGRVMTVTGQDVSSVNLRLSHCRATSWVFRTDKNMSDCTLTREFLMSQIL